MYWVGNQDTQAQALMPATSPEITFDHSSHSLFLGLLLVSTGHSPRATSMLITGESEMQSAPAMAQPQGPKVKTGAVLNPGSNMPDLLAGGWASFLGKPGLTRKFIFFG